MLDMSIYDDSVNKCLDYSRKMVKQINHIKGSNDLEDLQTIVFAGMLTYYGEENLDNIYLAFLKCNFVLVDKTIEKVIRDKYELSQPVISKIVKHCPGTFYDVEAGEFVNKKTRKRSYKFDRTLYVQTDGSIGIDDLLQSVTHQMNHVINSIHNPVVSTVGANGYGLASRMGVSFERFASRTSDGYGLESSINDLQAEEIMDEILGFSFFDVTDSGVKRILDEAIVEKDKKENGTSFSELTEIIRPLYQSLTFNPVLIKGRLNGRIRTIENEFDENTEVGAYSDFRLECDRLADSRISPLVANESREKVKSYVKQYTTNSISGSKASEE